MLRGTKCTCDSISLSDLSVSPCPSAPQLAGIRSCWAVREIPCCASVQLVWNTLVLNSAFLCPAPSHASFMKQVVAEIHTPSIQRVPSSSPGSLIIYGFLSRGRTSSLTVRFSCRYCGWPIECADAVGSTGPSLLRWWSRDCAGSRNGLFPGSSWYGAQPEHCSAAPLVPVLRVIATNKLFL